MEPTYYIFTDGGSRRSKGVGAFASVEMSAPIEHDHILDQQVWAYHDVTNNQMELAGFITGAYTLFAHEDGFSLDPTAPRIVIHVISDSQYLVKGVTEYLPTWQQNGYLTSARKPIKNLELWNIIETILDLYANVDFEFYWTKGHAATDEAEMTYATYYNDYCDTACSGAMEDLIAGTYTTNHTDFPAFIDFMEESLARFLL